MTPSGTNFTPGPWLAIGNYEYGWFEILTTDKNSRVIAEVACNPRPPKESQANARPSICMVLHTSPERRALRSPRQEATMADRGYQLCRDEDGLFWWKRCEIPGCVNLICARRSPIFCWPHSDSGSTIDELIENARAQTQTVKTDGANT